MSRNLDPAAAAALSADGMQWATLCMLTFKSSTQYLWTGPGPYTFNVNGSPQVFTGVGSLGSIGMIEEGSDGKVEGTTVSLSGIDPVFLAASLTDIKLGAPAMIWLAILNSQMQTVGQPYLWFSGLVDKPPIAIGSEEISVTLYLENLLSNHDRPSALKYTTADQRLLYPDDTSMDHVEELNDQALIWGS